MGAGLPSQTRWNIGTSVALALLFVAVITLSVLVGTRTGCGSTSATGQASQATQGHVRSGKLETSPCLALAQESGVMRVPLTDGAPVGNVTFWRDYTDPPLLLSYRFGDLDHVGEQGLTVTETSVTSLGLGFRFAMPAFPSHAAQNLQITTGVAANCVSSHFDFGTLFVACAGDVRPPQTVNFSFNPHGVGKSTFVDDQVVFPGRQPQGLITGTDVWTANGLVFLLCSTDSNGFCGAFSLDEGRTFEFVQRGLDHSACVAHFRVGHCATDKSKACLVFVDGDGALHAALSANAGRDWSEAVTLAGQGVSRSYPCSVLFWSSSRVFVTATTQSGNVLVFGHDGSMWTALGPITGLADVGFAVLVRFHDTLCLLADRRETGTSVLQLWSTSASGQHWQPVRLIAALDVALVGLDVAESNGLWWLVFGDETGLQAMQHTTAHVMDAAWIGPYPVGAVTNQRREPFAVTTSPDAVIICSTTASIVFQNVLPTAADVHWQAEGKVVLS